MTNLFLKKDLPTLVADASGPAGEGAEGDPGLKRSLGAFSLTMLGIGAIIGAGIFTLTGEAAAHYAGPAIVYSFILGGVLCALAGLCYAEMAAMIPVAGSAYAYSYATMGEFIAWIIGWDLVLEYAFGAVTVANGWSGYLFSLLHRTLGLAFPDAALRFTRGPWEAVTLGSGLQAPGYWNLPASFVALLVCAVIYRGITQSAWVNTFIVVVKVSIVAVFILLGIGMISGANLHANPAATGLASLVPARTLLVDAGQEVHRYGWLRGGVLTGAGVVFFAFIGFDAVSTTAQEARNPRRDMPISILSSLLVCTLLYVLVALTLTGVVSYRHLDVSDPIAVGIDQIVQLRHWTPLAQRAFTCVVKLGALAGLTSVILVLMLGQTRIFFSMAKDGLLPWFGNLHRHHRTPHFATVVTGVFVAACAGIMPISLVGKLVSIGTLLAFLLVCVGVPILRRTSPSVDRPFKVPMPWVVGLAGAASCLWVMSGLDLDTWVRLVVWLVVGLLIYFTYGRRHSRLQQQKGVRFGPLRVDLVGLGLVLAALAGLGWSLRGLPPAAQGGFLVFEHGAGILLGEGGVPVHLLGALACALLGGYGLRLVLGNRATSA
ncbi:MAG: amino acid permease [Holophaga sp.]|jgi:APA family basic amino acid/polyamine antiporter